MEEEKDEIFTEVRDVILFMKYAEMHVGCDILILERYVSKGFGYYDIYCPPSYSRRRNNVGPDVAADYLALLFRRDDKNTILNNHLSHLGDTIECKVDETFWLRRSRINIAITRRYGWRKEDEVRVSRYYDITLKDIDPDYFDKESLTYWKREILPRQLDHEKSPRDT